MVEKPIKRYCVYAIQNETAGRVYIGQTDSLERRIEKHNKQKVKAT